MLGCYAISLLIVDYCCWVASFLLHYAKSLSFIAIAPLSFESFIFCYLLFIVVVVIFYVIFYLLHSLSFIFYLLVSCSFCRLPLVPPFAFCLLVGWPGYCWVTLKFEFFSFVPALPLVTSILSFCCTFHLFILLSYTLRYLRYFTLPLYLPCLTCVDDIEERRGNCTLLFTAGYHYLYIYCCWLSICRWVAVVVLLAFAALPVVGAGWLLWFLVVVGWLKRDFCIFIFAFAHIVTVTLRCWSCIFFFCQPLFLLPIAFTFYSCHCTYPPLHLFVADSLLICCYFTFYPRLHFCIFTFAHFFYRTSFYLFLLYTFVHLRHCRAHAPAAAVFAARRYARAPCLARTLQRCCQRALLLVPAVPVVVVVARCRPVDLIWFNSLHFCGALFLFRYIFLSVHGGFVVQARTRCVTHTRCRYLPFCLLHCVARAHVPAGCLPAVVGAAPPFAVHGARCGRIFFCWCFCCTGAYTLSWCYLLSFVVRFSPPFWFWCGWWYKSEQFEFLRSYHVFPFVFDSFVFRSFLRSTFCWLVLVAFCLYLYLRYLLPASYLLPRLAAARAGVAVVGVTLPFDRTNSGMNVDEWTIPECNLHLLWLQLKIDFVVILFYWKLTVILLLFYLFILLSI